MISLLISWCMVKIDFWAILFFAKILLLESVPNLAENSHFYTFLINKGNIISFLYLQPILFQVNE